MTTFFNSLKQCGCCGKKVSVRELGSTNSFGSPDLDLRPPEMQRSAMLRRIQCCEHCGYVAWDLEESVRQTAELKKVLSESIDNYDDAQIFERAAKIAQLNGSDEEDVTFLYLCSAWCADDEKSTEQSVLMRKKILEICDLSAVTDPERLLQLIDIARRAGEFETACKLLEQFNKGEAEEPLLEDIARFQEKLLKDNDTSCYTVEEVTP